MHAIVESGGKQFQVKQGAKILVEKLDAKEGDEVTLDKVLLVSGETRSIGTPYVKGASVRAEVVAQALGPKVIIFKRRRRKSSKSKKGHRQPLTSLLIKEIIA